MQTATQNNGRLGYSIPEIAEATGLSVCFLRNEERAGRLKARRYGRRVIVLTADLQAYLEGEKHEEREAA